jgi:hypothetical protein
MGEEDAGLHPADQERSARLAQEAPDWLPAQAERAQMIASSVTSSVTSATARL